MTEKLSFLLLGEDFISEMQKNQLAVFKNMTGYFLLRCCYIPFLKCQLCEGAIELLICYTVYVHTEFVSEHVWYSICI